MNKRDSDSRQNPSHVRPLCQKTPRRLGLVTLQFGVDDGAGSAADGQLLSGLHLVTEVTQPPLRIHLKLLLQGGVIRFYETIQEDAHSLPLNIV